MSNRRFLIYSDKPHIYKLYGRWVVNAERHPLVGTTRGPVMTRFRNVRAKDFANYLNDSF